MYKHGVRLNIDKFTYIDFIWPCEDLISENVLNNNSVVCRLNYGKTSVLFTGDIEKIAEERILKEYENDLNILKSTILKVGHHGSKTSSIESFVKEVGPKIALIGVGEKNKFGHPNDAVIKRFENIRY